MNRTEPIVVTLLRHGEVAGRSNVLRGISDEPLTVGGALQMKQRLAGMRFDCVASSPLRRCREFAEKYSKESSLPLEILPEFREICFGKWENLSTEEAESMDPVCFRAFCETFGMHAPPDGESLASLRERVGRGWKKWIGEDRGKKRLLVTHACVMRALLMEIFGFSPALAFRFSLPTAACLRISHLEGSDPYLLSVNSCAD